MLGNLLSFAGSMFGGSKSRSAAKNQLAVQVAENAKQAELQREFAQKGVQWRVEDAKKAGLHPLYAIGAQGASFSPSAFIPGQAPTGDHYAQAGQALGRAADSYLNRKDAAYDRYLSEEQRKASVIETRQRARAARLQGDEIEDKLIRNRLNRQALAGAFATDLVAGEGTEVGPTRRTQSGSRSLALAGRKWQNLPGWSPAEDTETEAGDLASSIYGIAKSGLEVPYNLTATRYLWEWIRRGKGAASKFWRKRTR